MRVIRKTNRPYFFSGVDFNGKLFEVISKFSFHHMRVSSLTYRVVSPPTLNTEINTLVIKWHSKL